MLAPARGGLFVDCTVGLGGHCARAARAAARRASSALDRDPTALGARARGARAVRRSRRRSCTPTIAICRACSTRGGIVARRRRARRSRRVVDAARRRRARLQLSARRAARHADGSDAAGRTAADLLARRRRARAGGRDLPVRRGALLAAHRARASSMARRERADRRRPGGWRRSCGARFRDAATSGSIRRRARSRRCASGSTASSTGSTRSSQRRRGGCARARGWR